MEVVVVTGLARNSEAMQKCRWNLYDDGYRLIDNPASCNNHPRDITNRVQNEISVLHKSRPNGKFMCQTNSDHAINALRVMRFDGKIDSLRIKHFGPDGNEHDIEVGADGELSSYPDGLLDEWPNMMARLAPKGKEDK